MFCYLLLIRENVAAFVLFDRCCLAPCLAIAAALSESADAKEGKLFEVRFCYAPPLYQLDTATAMLRFGATL
jgi:hypothetical protein